MAVFSSKNNYICGAFFTGKSFLVLEFDNRKNKRTVRTKGEIEVSKFLSDNYEIADKVGFVEAAKNIRKNTKSKTICVNKKLDGVDLTHFFEIFSVAGFEGVRFVGIENILNDAFRKQRVHGTDCFLVIENDKYNFYISNEDEISLLATANSLDEVNLKKDEIKEALSEVLDSRIEIYGLENYEDLAQIEDLFYVSGYEAVIGNVWQNAFSINEHIPSIHFKESSKYALPVALALNSLKEKVPESKQRAERSISDDLGPKGTENNTKERLGESEKEKMKEGSEEKKKEMSETSKPKELKEPSIIEEKIIAVESFITSIDLPILNPSSSDKPEKMATYVPNIDKNFFTDWENFEEAELKIEKDSKKVSSPEKVDEKDPDPEPEKDVETDNNQQEEKQEQEQDNKEQTQKVTEDVLVEDNQEDSVFDDMLDEIMEEEIEEFEEVEVSVVEDSKVIKKKVDDGKAEKDKPKSGPGFFSRLFGKKDKELEKKEKAEKKKSKNNKNKPKKTKKKKKKRAKKKR